MINRLYKDFDSFFDTLKQQVQKDIKIEKSSQSINNFLLTAGVKSEKYSKLLTKIYREYYRIDTEIQIKYKELYMYYKHDFDMVLDKTELKHFINSNPEYTNLNNTLKELKIISEYLERVLKEIDSSTWNIKSIIELSKITGEIF